LEKERLKRSRLESEQKIEQTRQLLLEEAQRKHQQQQQQNPFQHKLREIDRALATPTRISVHSKVIRI